MKGGLFLPLLYEGFSTALIRTLARVTFCAGSGVFGQVLDEDEDVFLHSAFPDGRRCSPGLLSEELHAVRGETRVRSLHGHQHHHVQRNVLHAGKSLKVYHANSWR